jgi:hypothetical protein
VGCVKQCGIIQSGGSRGGVTIVLDTKFVAFCGASQVVVGFQTDAIVVDVAGVIACKQKTHKLPDLSLMALIHDDHVRGENYSFGIIFR